MDKNENKMEIISKTATIDVISSRKLNSALFVICKEVITIRQNPKRLAEVPSMCWDVIFAIKYFLSAEDVEQSLKI